MTLEAVYGTYATTDNEAQAAAIAQRLIGEEGRDATVWDVEDLVERGYPIRTSFRYAVLAARLEQM